MYNPALSRVCRKFVSQASGKQQAIKEFDNPILEEKDQ
jgi:hypothetical protein